MSKYCCQNCEKSFTTPQALKYHLSRKVCHPNNLLEIPTDSTCLGCGKTLTTKYSLQRHYKRFPKCAKAVSEPKIPNPNAKTVSIPRTQPISSEEDTDFGSSQLSCPAEDRRTTTSDLKPENISARVHPDDLKKADTIQDSPEIKPVENAPVPQSASQESTISTNNQLVEQTKPPEKTEGTERERTERIVEDQMVSLPLSLFGGLPGLPGLQGLHGLQGLQGGAPDFRALHGLHGLNSLQNLQRLPDLRTLQGLQELQELQSLHLNKLLDAAGLLRPSLTDSDRKDPPSHVLHIGNNGARDLDESDIPRAKPRPAPRLASVDHHPALEVPNTKTPSRSTCIVPLREEPEENSAEDSSPKPPMPHPLDSIISLANYPVLSILQRLCNDVKDLKSKESKDKDGEGEAENKDKKIDIVCLAKENYIRKLIQLYDGDEEKAVNYVKNIGCATDFIECDFRLIKKIYFDGKKKSEFPIRVKDFKRNKLEYLEENGEWVLDIRGEIVGKRLCDNLVSTLLIASSLFNELVIYEKDEDKKELLLDLFQINRTQAHILKLMERKTQVKVSRRVAEFINYCTEVHAETGSLENVSKVYE